MSKATKGPIKNEGKGNVPAFSSILDAADQFG